MPQVPSVDRRLAGQRHQRAGLTAPAKLHCADSLPVCSSTGDPPSPICKFTTDLWYHSASGRQHIAARHAQVFQAADGTRRRSVGRQVYCYAPAAPPAVRHNRARLHATRYFRFEILCRYTQHQHVTFKLREVVKPYKKIVGHAPPAPNKRTVCSY